VQTANPALARQIAKPSSIPLAMFSRGVERSMMKFGSRERKWVDWIFAILVVLMLVGFGAWLVAVYVLDEYGFPPAALTTIQQ
jgi:hypothetical protein